MTNLVDSLRTTSLDITCEAPQANDYCDQRTFQKNRLPTRSYFLPESTLLLNGVWEFYYAPSPVEAPEQQELDDIEVFTPSETSEGSSEVSPRKFNWTNINVPGHWVSGDIMELLLFSKL